MITMQKREKPLETTVLISDVGSLELLTAKQTDSENVVYHETKRFSLIGEKKELYASVKPVVLSIDPSCLVTRLSEKIFARLLFGKRIHIRSHFILKSEPFTRECHTGKFVCPDHKKEVLKRYEITEEELNKTKDKKIRPIVDVSDIDFATQEKVEIIKSGFLKEFWRAAKGRGISDWLPWVVTGIVALAGFGALLVQQWLFLQI